NHAAGDLRQAALRPGDRLCVRRKIAKAEPPSGEPRPASVIGPTRSPEARTPIPPASGSPASASPAATPPGPTSQAATHELLGILTHRGIVAAKGFGFEIWAEFLRKLEGFALRRRHGAWWRRGRLARRRNRDAALRTGRAG